MKIVFGQIFTRNAKNDSECLSLSGVEILQFVPHNLRGFDLGLEAGSK